MSSDAAHPEIVETPNVESVTAGGSAAIALNNTAATFLTLISDTKIFIKVGASDVALPNKTTTSGTGRCWMIPADTEWSKHIDGSDGYIRILPDSGTALVRWFVEQKT